MTQHTFMALADAVKVIAASSITLRAGLTASTNCMSSSPSCTQPLTGRPGHVVGLHGFQNGESNAAFETEGPPLFASERCSGCSRAGHAGTCPDCDSAAKGTRQCSSIGINASGFYQTPIRTQPDRGPASLYRWPSESGFLQRNSTARGISPSRPVVSQASPTRAGLRVLSWGSAAPLLSEVLAKSKGAGESGATGKQSTGDVLWLDLEHFDVIGFAKDCAQAPDGYMANLFPRENPTSLIITRLGTTESYCDCVGRTYPPGSPEWKTCFDPDEPGDPQPTDPRGPIRGPRQGPHEGPDQGPDKGPHLPPPPPPPPPEPNTDFCEDLALDGRCSDPLRACHSRQVCVDCKLCGTRTGDPTPREPEDTGDTADTGDSV